MRLSDLPDPTSDSKLDGQYRSEAIRTLKIGRWVLTALFVILLGVICYFAGIVLNVLSLPVGIIIWTIIFVFCLRGIVNYCDRKGIGRLWGTIIAYAVMFLIVAAAVFLLFSPMFGIGDQFSSLLNSIPKYIDDVRNWYNNLYAQYSNFFQDQRVNDFLNSAFASLTEWFSQLAQNSAEGVISFGSGLVNTVLVIGFALVVAFWILLELPKIGAEVKRIVAPKRQEDLHMFHVTITRVMGGYIKATLIQCTIIGVVCGIGYAFMGIPTAAPLGVITGIMNIIPVIGPWIGGILAAIVGIFVSPLIAFIALVFTIVVQQVVYTFISPKLMANSVDIHPTIVFIALMTGSAIGYAMSGFMGSFLGMLAAIPLVAAGKAIFVYYFEKRSGRTIVSTDGVFFKSSEDTEELNPLADATGEFSAINKS